MRKYVLVAMLVPVLATAQLGRGSAEMSARPDSTAKPVLLVPDRVWNAVDDAPHEGWAVLVRGDRIEAVGPLAQLKAPTDATTISLPGTTLLPGLIEGHSHLLLHPY